MNKELTTNTTLSHYRIVSKIGEGGMGEVWLAEDTRLGRKVALKLLPAEFTEDSERVRRFTQEAKAASALNHPNIISVYDIGESESGRFIVMEFVAGHTLRSVIVKDNSLETFFALGAQMAKALSAAHAAGITHRDIKPDNIMVRDDGYVKMLDFGLARLLPTTSSDPEAMTLAQQTTPGTVMGTLAYMSPEQASGQTAASGSDVFALGIVLYELATGRHPFKSETMIGYLHAITSQTPPPMTSIKSELPPALDELMLRMLEKDIRLRPRASEVAQALQEIEKFGSSKTLPIRVVTHESKRADDGFWVAVLPFKATGTNVDLSTLAEGLSDEIVTGLNRFSYLRVIARSSTLRYASETCDVRTIGKTLGARYVMEGGVRQAGSVLRVTVQLIDAHTGAHLWAETYDRPFRSEDIFALQDDLVPRIVSTVADQHGVLPHTMSEVLRFRDPDSLRPHEVVLRVFGYYERGIAAEHATLRTALERAVEEAPGNADCWAMLAIMYCDEYKFGFNPLPDSLGRARASAQRAVEASASNPFAYEALAQALFFRREFNAFRNAAERAIALNPLDGATTAFMGMLMASAGDWEHGCAVAERATQLNPHHPGWYWGAAIWNAYRKGDYSEALKIGLKFNMPGFYHHHLNLAAIYGQLGEREPASKALRDLLALKPDFAANARDELGKFFDSELAEHMIDGLRKAGLEIVGEAGVAHSSVATETTDLRSPTGLESRPAIAVLPFDNLSSEADNEYFCDGLAEDLLGALSKIEALRVAARTSAFSFKGKGIDVREIGKKLNVATVLEGSVRKSGDRLRISAQLINIADGYQLWSERYDRQLEDIFDIQDEISLAIVDALKVKLWGGEKAAVLKRHTDNTEAYQLYLKGRFFVNQRTSASLHKAIEFFNQAISLDPDYALGYAGLTDAYMVLGVPDAVTEALSAQEALPKARAAAERAIEIDNTVGEIYPPLAHAKWKQRDWAGAESDYKRGIELNPNYPIAHFYYAVFLASLGRNEEAVKEINRARELDPLSLPVNASITYVLFFARQYDEAINVGKQTLELDPAFPLTHQRLGLAYVQKKMYPEAITGFQLAVNNSNRAPQSLISLGHAYAMSGNKVEAEKLLDELKEMSHGRYVSSYGISTIHAGLGDKEGAFQWLNKAYDEQNTELTFLKADPRLDPLRDDPRLQELIRRMRFPGQ